MTERHWVEIALQSQLATCASCRGSSDFEFELDKGPRRAYSVWARSGIAGPRVGGAATCFRNLGSTTDDGAVSLGQSARGGRFASVAVWHANQPDLFSRLGCRSLNPRSPTLCPTRVSAPLVRSRRFARVTRESTTTMEQKPVLIVEDDENVSEVFSLGLSDTCDVKRAATGREGLDILRREPVGAVVLDYRLPDGTGLDVLSDIRSANLNVPVIMVTGYGSESVCTSAFRLGVVDYLTKPVAIFDLVRCIQRVLAPSGRESKTVDKPASVAHEPAPVEAMAAPPDLPIQKAVQLIRHRYWDSLSLAQLAREIGISKYRLSHRFTQVMGVSLRKYLLGVRLERAKHLLSSRHLSITEVAQAVGFSDLPRFDKLFRRHTGITPSTYRAQALARGPS